MTTFVIVTTILNFIGAGVNLQNEKMLNFIACLGFAIWGVILLIN